MKNMVYGTVGPNAGVDYNLTLCPLQNRFQHIYHGQPYAREDLYNMPEATLFPSQGLSIWPLSSKSSGKLLLSAKIKTICWKPYVKALGAKICLIKSSTFWDVNKKGEKEISISKIFHKSEQILLATFSLLLCWSCWFAAECGGQGGKERTHGTSKKRVHRNHTSGT